MRSLAVVLVLGTAAGAGALAQEAAGADRQTRAEQAANAPQVHVPEESLELGTVREGADVKARFVIENRGQAELRILRAKPS